MCFTSPISSMKFTKSILRPVRGGAASLSYLTRPFRARRTITGRKRGGAFEAHEPSSPKVTCIGQVRVKSKKRVRQCRRRIGEVSFRTTERVEDGDKVWIRPQRFSNSGSQSHRDQRWVHLPVSVCEALRAFRAEICCFFPCGCSCFSSARRRRRESDACYADEDGCGTVLARWLVAVNGGEVGRRREIEVVVGGGDEERAEVVSIRSSRRHVFEDFEIRDLVGEKGEEEAARVSICIPPKNALLLMRCRSDPIKMAALENADRNYEDRDTEDDESDSDENSESVNQEESESVATSEEQQLEIAEIEEDEECNLSFSVTVSVSDEENTTKSSESAEIDRIEKQKADETEELTEEKSPIISEEEFSIPEEETEQEEQNVQIKSEPEVCIQEEEEEEKPVMAIINPETKKQDKSGGLPECLLLMMCEPKLSMEVSKETWVRGTDFIRLLPERPLKPAKAAAATGGGGDQEPVKRSSKCRPRVPAPPSRKNDHQPARSSCSLPAAAAVIERNQVSSGKCEPFALTRCKSEPMSTAAAKLMPESC